MEPKVVGAKGDGAFTTTAAEAYRGEKALLLVLLLSRAQFAALAPSMDRRELFWQPQQPPPPLAAASFSTFFLLRSDECWFREVLIVKINLVRTVVETVDHIL